MLTKTIRNNFNILKKKRKNFFDLFLSNFGNYYYFFLKNKEFRNKKKIKIVTKRRAQIYLESKKLKKNIC